MVHWITKENEDLNIIVNFIINSALWSALCGDDNLKFYHRGYIGHRGFLSDNKDIV